MALMDGAQDLPFNSSFERVDKGPELPMMDDTLLRSLSHDQHIGFRYYRLLRTGSQ